MRRSLAAALLFLGAVAHAQPARDAAPAYPLEVTDRPLMMPAGMKELSFSLAFTTNVETMTDEMGNTTRTQTALGDRVLWGLDWRRAYGAVTLYGGLGTGGATVAATFRLGQRAVIGGALRESRRGTSNALWLTYTR